MIEERGKTMLFFRKATVDDTHYLKQLILQSGISNHGVEDHIDQFIIMETDEKEIVGTVGLEKFADCGLIRSLVMNRDHTSEEILLRLLQEALKMAKDQGAAKVYLLTKVIPLFQSIGFYPVNIKNVPNKIVTSDHVSQYDTEQITIMEYKF
jgi:amino-acid N-acetyltransferase